MTLLVCMAGFSVSHGKEAVEVVVEPSVTRVVRLGSHEHSGLDRNIYFRTYGNLSGTELSQKLFGELGVLPGRGTMRTLTADKKSADEGVKNLAAHYGAADGLFGSPVHAICCAAIGKELQKSAGASAGDSSEVDATMRVAQSKVVSPQKYGLAARLILEWAQGVADGAGRAPDFISTMNEPDASWADAKDPVGEFCAYSRVVAEGVNGRAGGVKIAGPCTAWGYQGGDWKRWSSNRWERAYIEKVGDVTGAYDFHFYSKGYYHYVPESRGYNGKLTQNSPFLDTSRRSGNSNVWDFGRMEAFLDLISAHHLSVWGGEMKPVIISEFGRQGIYPQFGPWENDFKYWLYMSTVSRFWMTFMEFPQVKLTVPFILARSDANYAPMRGQAIYTQNPEGGEKRTPFYEFYELFKDLRGARVACGVSSESAGLLETSFARAFLDGEKLYILLHNGKASGVDFNLKIKGAPPLKSARLSGVKWVGEIPGRVDASPKGRIEFLKNSALALPLESLHLAADETALICAEFESAPQMRTRTEKIFYAKETFQKLDEYAPPEITFTLPSGKFKTAELGLGLAAIKGFKGAVKVFKGGAQIAEASLGHTQGITDYHALTRVEIDSSLLKAGGNVFRVELSDYDAAVHQYLISARLTLFAE